MLQDIFMDIYNTVYALVVNIPVDNVWGVLYVVVNTVVSLLLTLFGYSGNGSIFSSF